MGHLFQGRFKAVLVDRDSYLLKVCRYVELNSVRAGMVAVPPQVRPSHLQPDTWAQPDNNVERILTFFDLLPARSSRARVKPITDELTQSQQVLKQT